jgi:nucleotide-binding universal stress UspA family protein
VHAIYVPESKPGSNMYDGLKRFLFDTAREWITKHQAEAGTNWDVCIESGAVANVLREMAAQSRADVIVIGRGRLQNHLGRLRTNVGAIIRQAPCPLLSV